MTCGLHKCAQGLFLEMGVRTCLSALHREAGDKGRQHNTGA